MTPLYTVHVKTKMHEYIIDNIFRIKGWTSVINFLCYFPAVLLAALITAIGSEEKVGSPAWILTVIYFIGFIVCLSVGAVITLFICTCKYWKRIPNTELVITIEFFEHFILEYRPEVQRKIFFEDIVKVEVGKKNNCLEISSRLSSDLRPFNKSQESLVPYLLSIPMDSMSPGICDGICQLLRANGKKVPYG